MPPDDQADASAVLDRQFLEMRARILELGAALDRLDRAPGGVDADARYQALRTALELLADERPDRAARIQLVFSRPYDERWRTKFGL